MNKINIKLTADAIAAKAGEIVQLSAEFSEVCNSCVHERRRSSGYTRLTNQTGKTLNYEATVHDDTTDFIVSTSIEGRPNLSMEGNNGQLWCPVTVKSDEPQPAPVPKDMGKLLYKVGLISDVHFDVEDTKNSEYSADLKNALEYFRKENVAFISSCGDFVQYNDKDFETFKQGYKTGAWYPSNGNLRLLTPMGNHDYLRIYHKRDSVPSGYASVEMIWQNNISPFHEPEDALHFFEYGAKWNAPKKTGKRTIKSKLNYWMEYQGDIYVFMSVDYGSSIGSPWDDVIRGFNLLDYNDLYVQNMTSYVSDTAYDRSRERNFDYQFYHPEVLCWLKDILENNKDKRVFVFSHHFLPHKAGDSDGMYSHLRVWPYPTSEAVRNKFYSGSNTLCGLTFHFLNKLNNEYRNAVFFSGHCHREIGSVCVCNHDYPVKLPTGNEVTPLVDNLDSLTDTVYDYRLYTRTSSTPKSESGYWISIPSLAKPVSDEGSTLYQASQGGMMEVYENGIVVNFIVFKAGAGSNYVNFDIKKVEI